MQASPPWTSVRPAPAPPATGTARSGRRTSGSFGKPRLAMGAANWRTALPPKGGKCGPMKLPRAGAVANSSMPSPAKAATGTRLAHSRPGRALVRRLPPPWAAQVRAGRSHRHPTMERHFHTSASPARAGSSARPNRPGHLHPIPSPATPERQTGAVNTTQPRPHQAGVARGGAVGGGAMDCGWRHRVVHGKHK